MSSSSSVAVGVSFEGMTPSQKPPIDAVCANKGATTFLTHRYVHIWKFASVGGCAV